MIAPLLEAVEERGKGAAYEIPGHSAVGSKSGQENEASSGEPVFARFEIARQACKGTYEILY